MPIISKLVALVAFAAVVYIIGKIVIVEFKDLEVDK